MNEDVLVLELRSSVMRRSDAGRNYWETLKSKAEEPTSRVALLLCDVWDRHWCRGASERVDSMAPRIDEFTQALRRRGARIIHSPSDTMSFYANHPARLRIQSVERVEPPFPLDLPDPPLPSTISDGGSDTGEPSWYTAWSRQHASIEIDPDRDVISDNGSEIYSYLLQEKVQFLLIAGVHTNMCVLGRSFGIKQMVRWGVRTALVRDLTDTMYNPARSPYVDHDVGTGLVVEYIEKFWCPTVDSDSLLAGRPETG